MSSVAANVDAASENAAINPVGNNPVDTSAFGKLPFVKDLVNAQKDLGQGNIDGLTTDIENYVVSAATFALDPVGFLVGTGVEFVLNFVQPVQDAIRLVTGDKDALNKGAQAFEQIKGQLDELAKNLTEALDSDLANYDGAAADALRKKMAKFVEGVHNTGGQAHNIGQLLQMSGTMMEAAEGVIKGILRDFITWALMTWIPALAASGPTFGGSVAAATAATTAEGAATCARTAAQIARITRIIQHIMDVITAIKAIIDSIRIYDSVEKITEGSKGDGGKGTDDQVSKEAGQGNKVIGAGKTGLDQAAKGYKYKAEWGGYTVDDDGDVARVGPDGARTKVDEQGTPVVDEEGRPVTTQPSDPKYTGTQLGRSVGTNVGAGLGTAADKLEKQAQDGGFDKVPADKSISGELDW